MEQSEPPKKKKPSLTDYGKYSSLVFQMAATVAIGVFGGIKTDEWLGMHIPVFTVLLSFIGVIAAVYFAVKDLVRKK